jgi:hypothetical protein
MEDTKPTNWAVFAIKNIFNQIQSLAYEIGMESAEIIMVLQCAERGVDIEGSYMAIKTIPRPKKILRCQDSTDDMNTNFMSSFDSGLVSKSAFAAPKSFILTESRFEDEALNDSNLVASLNRLVVKGAYLATKNLNSIEKIKHLTLSAGIHDRITTTKRGSIQEILDRIKSEVANRRDEMSDNEAKCLQELIRRQPGYVWNNTLYFNAFVNGTPDAVLFGPDGNVIRCAEFKYTTSEFSRQQKFSGIGQLTLYMSIFGISKGDLLIRNSAGKFEYFEVGESQTRANEKICLFSEFRQYIIDSNNEAVSSIKDLNSLVKPDANSHPFSCKTEKVGKAKIKNNY